MTAEQLREHGIKVNNSEIIVLNQHLHVREHPPTVPYAIAYVVKKDEPVDNDRIARLLAYIVKYVLPEEQAAAWGEATRRELVAV